MVWVVFKDNYYSPDVQYVFTGLSDIKPDILSEAITNAKRAAKEFAVNTDDKLGKFKKASQVVCSIMESDGFFNYGIEGGNSYSNES